MAANFLYCNTTFSSPNRIRIRIQRSSCTVRCSSIPQHNQNALSRRTVAITLVIFNALSIPTDGRAEGALDKYVKRKKLDPLEVYVPPVILTQFQIKDLVKTLEGDQPQYASYRSILRSGPAASLRVNIRAGLLGLIPFVSSDLEARNALWSVLGRYLVCIQEDEMGPSSLHQYVTVFVEKYDIIQDDIIDHQISPTEAASLRRIYSILQRWTQVKENVKNDNIAVDSEEDEIAEKLRRCCEKYVL